MKGLITFFSFLAVIMAWLLLPAGGQPAISNSTGSGNGGGNTGSVGDGGTTCAQSFCHSGAPEFYYTLGSITSTVPNTGYVPGQTYTITASITKSGHNIFGFELTSETPGGTKIGTLSSTSSETQLTNNTNAVTHTSSGNFGSGSKSWSMDWQAPSAGTGEIVLQAAFNVTNGNGSPSGDTLYIDSIHVQEDSSASAIPSAQMVQENSITVYPTPAKDRITLQNVPQELKDGELLLRDLQGRVLRTLFEGDLSYTEGRSFELDLVAGSYLLEFRGEDERTIERILVR